MIFRVRKIFLRFLMFMLYLGITIKTTTNNIVKSTQNSAVLLLTKNNFDTVKEGAWCVTFNKERADMLAEYSTNNVAYLNVDNLDAAKFQPNKYSEVIFVENGKITSKYGCRSLLCETQIGMQQSFDFFLYFTIKRVQQTLKSINKIEMFKNALDAMW